jgi:hypothetical protein
MSRTRTPRGGEGHAEGHAPWAGELLTRDPFDGPKPEAYDALADLFLGDQQGGAEPARRPEDPMHSRATPMLRLTPEMPEPSPGAAPGQVEERDQVVPAPTGRIEGLILGHLPVIAGAWVMQYARHAASGSSSPVALVRLRSGEGTLEVLGPAAAGALGEDRRFASFADAVAHLAGRIGLWLVRVEETAEPTLAELPGVDALTLLSGADEAATVAAYRAIKHLLPADAEAQGPSVRLAIMGASADKSAAGAAKLARAAEAFLRRTIEVAPCIQKIGGGPRSELAWSGRVEAPVEETLRWLCAAVHEHPLDAAPAVRTVTLAPLIAAAAQVEHRQHVAPSEPESTLPTFEPLPDLEAPPTLEPIPAPSAPIMDSIDLPSSRPGLLARHLPSLAALSITCPYAPSVELAVAEDGALHLLALEGSAGEQPAVAQLVTAAAWVRDHMPLLRLAAPADGRRLSEADPILHLLTTRAAAIRRLGESGVRLHVLTNVRVGDQTAWACADLN